MNKFTMAVLSAGLSVGAQADLVITGVYDGPLSGGVPKGVELYVINDIADLSIYGLGSANNGGGSDGQEFSFPAVAATAGAYIYVASDDIGFTDFFGFAPTYTSNAMSINGDDAIELFANGAVIDIFGDINVDGSGQPWEYLDGWSYRRSGTVAGTNFSDTDWVFSGRNALDGATSNADAATPVPVGEFTTSGNTGGGDNGGGDNGGGTPATPQLISAIQGTPETQGSNQFGETDVSPLVGEVVTIEGIVVGDFQEGDSDDGRNLSGFFVQEETSDEDGDAASSEGIFVLDNDLGVDVALGDMVRVTGTVDQYFGETQLDTVTSVEIIASDLLGAVTPATIALSEIEQVTQAQGGAYQPDLEAYEGMLVSFSDTLQITEQFQLDRFNEIKLVAGQRPVQFTQDNTPDSEQFLAAQQALGARRITYDDGLNTQNATINNLDGFAIYSELAAKRMGDTVSNLTGVLDYKWAGNRASGATWRVRSHVDGTNVFTSTLDGNSPNARPAALPSVDGNLKIASFNVLNFFTTIDESGVLSAVGQDPRGADSVEEFDRQLSKLLNAIVALDADVLGLVEIENEFDETNDGSTAIEVLVNALNERLGSEVYQYVYPGQQFLGTDAIAVGMLYKPAVVKLADESNVVFLDDSVAATLDVFSNHDFDANPIFNGPATNRVALAASFTHIDSDDSFTVVANHFKSKGPSSLEDTTNPNFDQGDGAAFWNVRRLDAAIAVREWLATSPTGVVDPDQVILGDLNAYRMEAPVQYLLNNGFNNVESDDAYSFVFDGQVGTLDYVLISDALQEKFNNAALWHINADEADAIDYNLDFGRDAGYFDAATATRNSDHDPLLAGFTLDAKALSVAELIEVFNEGMRTGDIRGAGNYFWWQHINLYFYNNLLEKAKRLEKRGYDQRACRVLKRAYKRADGDARPRDLIKGAGVAEFSRLLSATVNRLGC